MRFKAKKSYGNYKTTTCPFCSRIATQKNEQGLDVCTSHTKSKLEEIKCTCGSWLECRNGKFGPYFNCMNCGNLNYNKVMEIKAITMKDQKPVVDKPKQTISSYKSEDSDNYESSNYNPNRNPISSSKSSFSNQKKKKEITITTDDGYYFD